MKYFLESESLCEHLEKLPRPTNNLELFNGYEDWMSINPADSEKKISRRTIEEEPFRGRKKTPTIMTRVVQCSKNQRNKTSEELCGQHHKKQHLQDSASEICKVRVCLYQHSKHVAPEINGEQTS